MPTSSPDTAVRSKPIIERHVQTVLLALVVGLLAWSGNTTMTLIETSARQDERITQLINLTEQLRNDLRAVGSEYMTISDAALYRDQLNSKIDSLSARVSQLESRQ